MTETRGDNQSNPANSSALESYLRTWADTIGSVLGQVAAARFGDQTLTVDWEDAPSVEASVEASVATGTAVPPSGLDSTTSIFLNITLAGALRGEQVLGLSFSLARWLAQTFMGEPSIEPPSVSTAGGAPETPPDSPSELSTDHRDALEELFRQIAGVTVTSLKPKWGEVKIHVQAGSVPTWPSAAAAWIRSTKDLLPPLAIGVRLSAALAAALRTAEASEASGAQSPAAASLPSSPETFPRKEEPGAVNLELLKNVPLDLTLRFGQRRMLLREILELGPGSVIELDRRLKDPVDLLLDGRVLARGEVVVIQGHYGLRVTEIAKAGSAEQ